MMFSENQASLLFGKIGLMFAVKSIFLLLILFFVIFTLMLFRQVQLMGSSLPTPTVPFIKFVSIILIGFSFAVLVLVAGTF